MTAAPALSSQLGGMDRRRPFTSATSWVPAAPTTSTAGCSSSRSLSQGSGSAAFNVSGGTLQASGAFSSSLPMTVGGGGVTFDTARYSVDSFRLAFRSRQPGQIGPGHSDPDRHRDVHRRHQHRQRHTQARFQPGRRHAPQYHQQRDQCLFLGLRRRQATNPRQGQHDQQPTLQRRGSQSGLVGHHPARRHLKTAALQLGSLSREPERHARFHPSQRHAIRQQRHHHHSPRIPQPSASAAMRRSAGPIGSLETATDNVTAYSFYTAGNLGTLCLQQLPQTSSLPVRRPPSPQPSRSTRCTERHLGFQMSSSGSLTLPAAA